MSDAICYPGMPRRGSRSRVLVPLADPEAAAVHAEALRLDIPPGDVIRGIVRGWRVGMETGTGATGGEDVWRRMAAVVPR